MLRGAFEVFINSTALTSIQKASLVRELKPQLIRQQSFFTQQNSQAKAATETSLQESHSVIKHKKSFQDGEKIKEVFVEAADSLFRDFKNKPEILLSSKFFSYQEV